MNIGGNGRRMMKGGRNREGGNNGMSRRERRRKEKEQGSREDLSVHNTLAQQQTFRGQRQGDEIKARRKPKGGRNGTPPLKTVGDATGVFLFLFLFFGGGAVYHAGPSHL